MQVIAEIKKASPSAGVLRDPFDPAAIALSYASAGAACLSVLTDIDYFQGSLANLRTARNAVNIPVLRKDFLIDPLQVIESRAAGADAILLIAEILDSESLKQMHELAQSFGMDVLVEMHDVASLDKIKTLNPPLAGINNRDLNTFVTRLDHSLEMRPHLPADALVVSESGIREPSDITKLMAGGIKAVLVGETFMRAPDPGARLSWLLGQSA
jgi:indole-3-glycerol phosphate synthase